MFAFAAYDFHDSTPLGGGLYYNMDNEAAYDAACKEFQRLHPKRVVHVEEITVEEYVAATGVRIEGVNEIEAEGDGGFVHLPDDQFPPLRPVRPGTDS